MPVRSSPTVVVAVAVLLVLGLPASASAAAAPAGDEASRGNAAAGEPSGERQARRKAGRRCRAGRVRRQRHGQLKHRRPCRRRARFRRRHRAPVPDGPILPTTPPPALVPPAPLPPAPPAPPTTSCPGADAAPSASNLPLVRAAALCLVNLERARYGVAPLADNAQLASAAQLHASDMVASHYFSHVSADGRTFDQRIRASGYLGSYLAENIAWGGGSLGTPRRVVNGWMNSAGHRANILNGLLTDSGIGISAGTPDGWAGGTYVHDFGAP